jgi:hypothetical protein
MNRSLQRYNAILNYDASQDRAVSARRLGLQRIWIRAYVRIVSNEMGGNSFPVTPVVKLRIGRSSATLHIRSCSASDVGFTM